MKVILLSDVASLGRKGAVVEVAEGYGRNYLLPRGMAQEASRGALAVLGEQRKASERREAESLAEARALAERLTEAKLVVSVRAGGNGKLFGAVTNADVAGAIERALGIRIDRHKIELRTQIKNLGTYPVEVKLHKNVVARAAIDVVSG